MCVRCHVGISIEASKRGAAREDQAVDGDDNRRALQVLELGMLDFAIDLRQALLAAHGQHGVAEGHQDAEQAQQRHQLGSLEKAQRIVAELEIVHGRRRRQMSAPHHHRVNAPDQQNHHHDGGDLHDPQSLAARLLDALDVLPPVVDRDHGGEHGRGVIHVELEGGIVVRVHQSRRQPVAAGRNRQQLVHQAGNILPGRHAGDRAR